MLGAPVIGTRCRGRRTIGACRDGRAPGSTARWRLPEVAGGALLRLPVDVDADERFTHGRCHLIEQRLQAARETVMDLARTDELIGCLANSGRRELRQ